MTRMSYKQTLPSKPNMKVVKKVQVGNDQEKEQLETIFKEMFVFPMAYKDMIHCG